MTINTDRLLKLADVIEQHPRQLYMGFWCGGEELDLLMQKGLRPIEAMAEIDLTVEGCRTSGCAAGWTVSLWGGEIDPLASFQENARAILGLDRDQASILFTGHLDGATQVVRVLRNIVDFGFDEAFRMEAQPDD